MVFHTEENDVHLSEYHPTDAGLENTCTKALLHQKVTGGEVISTLVTGCWHMRAMEASKSRHLDKATRNESGCYMDR